MNGLRRHRGLLVLLLLLLLFAGWRLWSGHFTPERWAQAEEGLRLAYADWGRSQTFFHTIMEHAELDEAESLFAAAFAACDTQDAPDFHAAMAQLASQLRLLAETQAVSIKNIL